MFFNSFEFAIFLPIAFLCYWYVFSKSLKLQNLWIIAASYFFYACWDWRFLSLIIISSAVDFAIGLALGRTSRKSRRKLLLMASLFTNLGILGIFKYCNFFIDSLMHLNPGLRNALGNATFDIVLPVGISFYTFQTLSYTIDVYRKKLKPTKDPLAFFAFVSFFPQLVAGPIERASNLLHQFTASRQFDCGKAADGMRQMLWGLMKKALVADTCAVYAERIFSGWTDYSGSTLFLGAVFFAVQIYCDFSGYSDIAIGAARLFGFDLKRNFNYPYFSRDMAEFWRRWHISLSTWFRDYLYIPLGGSRVGLGRKIANVLIIFAVSGLWHGANWTFVIWGLINALFFLPLILAGKNRRYTDIPAEGKLLPSVKEAMQMASTFLITCIAWVFFRAENIGQAIGYLQQIISPSLISRPEVFPKALLLGLALFFAIEWFSRHKEHPLQVKSDAVQTRMIRWAFYGLIVLAIGIAAPTTQTPFIYFQF